MKAMPSLLTLPKQNSSENDHISCDTVIKMKLPDIEEVAAKVHEAWLQAKSAQGVTSRKSETGEELMVPYSLLSESAKELDRASVRAVYSAIEALVRENNANG
jgi:hypothetical protein